MPNLSNRRVAEITLRAATKHLRWHRRPYVGRRDLYEQPDGRCKAHWKKLTETELQLAIRMLAFAGFDIVRRREPDAETNTTEAGDFDLG
jgi:hypothetical protein